MIFYSLPKDNVTAVDMDAILRECRAHVDLFMNYQFDEAMKACESKRDQSFVFECGTAALTAIRALFSMEEVNT